MNMAYFLDLSREDSLNILVALGTLRDAFPETEDLIKTTLLQTFSKFMTSAGVDSSEVEEHKARLLGGSEESEQQKQDMEFLISQLECRHQTLLDLSETIPEQKQSADRLKELVNNMKEILDRA